MIEFRGLIITTLHGLITWCLPQNPAELDDLQGPNVKAVATAVEQIYPFVFESRKEIL